MDNKIIRIDFRKFISSISLALDLAEACAFRDKNRKIDFEVAVPGFNALKHNFAMHSKKTALVSMFIAKALEYKGSRLDNLYIASYLHDIGAVDAFSICHVDRNFVKEHSGFGAEIIKRLPIDIEISNIIKYHHEHYNGTGVYGISKDSVPEESYIVHIADMFELMYDESIPYRYQRESIMNWFSEKRGVLFSPDITDALLSSMESERFWLDIENLVLEPDILERTHPAIYTPVSLEKLVDISKVFATIIDKKSNFTHQHSIGLTDKAEKFSQYYNFDSEKATMLKISALLHDLGKLSIPNHILDKPGKLTAEEFSIIKSHTYYTKLILEKINGMELISEWASNHHENLRGTGYPERLKSEALSFESRIIAVSDVYQALTEDRPYRPGMSEKNAISIIDSMVEGNYLDASIVKGLKDII